MKSHPTQRPDQSLRALVIHPDRGPSAHNGRGPAARLEEAIGLSQALGLEIASAQVAPIRREAPATLFRSGKVTEFGELCQDQKIELAVIDDDLSPVQQRNLERAWKVKVVDRTGLILEIFGRRARTSEGRLQVELARLQYERSRLVRTWTHLERQRGGFGFLGGPGETQIEADRRLITDRIQRLKAELADVRRTRSLQRRARRRVPYPVVALVGYTNAGKSTLFNRLTGSDVDARNVLFATLDPTLRQLRLPHGRSAVLSDTVGFVSDLPHELIEAFRATLEEVIEADVIVHVRDIAAVDTESERDDVARVLEDLGVRAGDGRLVEAWNKIDLLGPEARVEVISRAGRAGAVAVSARTGENCEALIADLAARVDSEPEVDVEVAAADGEALAWLYRHGRITARQDIDGSVRLRARLDTQALGRFESRFSEALVRR
ncbi:MAG TPA: GTPase HflX [Caulobacteraceae bacterium]|nr:GTPase HflX [Caulobacteraceae bacterium]